MAKKKNSFLQAILLGTAAVLFWRGAWGLMDLYIFPDHEQLSYITSLIIGIGTLFATRKLTDDLL
jgi:hypothetical protein